MGFSYNEIISFGFPNQYDYSENACLEDKWQLGIDCIKGLENELQCNHKSLLKKATVCFIKLDRGIQMIIFKSILTTFIASVISRGLWGSCKNCLELKNKIP
jgi:hypothetical protein